MYVLCFSSREGGGFALGTLFDFCPDREQALCPSAVLVRGGGSSLRVLCRSSLVAQTGGTVRGAPLFFFPALLHTVNKTNHEQETPETPEHSATLSRRQSSRWLPISRRRVSAWKSRQYQSPAQQLYIARDPPSDKRDERDNANYPKNHQLALVRTTDYSVE